MLHPCYGYLTTAPTAVRVAIFELHFAQVLIECIMYTAYIKEVKGWFAFVHFKELAHKVTIRKGMNE